MKKVPKGLKITLWVVIGLLVLLLIIAGMAGNQPTNPEAEKAKAELEACCKDVANSLNETYISNGFVVSGFAYDTETACYSVVMPYTTEEIKTLYSQDSQSLRDWWVNIARSTWDYLAEHEFDGAPADVEVVVYVYATDSKESVVCLTKHDTELKAK